MGNSHSDVELMYRMAQTMGVDLRKRQSNGALDKDTLARLEQRCMECSNPTECALKLDGRACRVNPPAGQWPPSYCIDRKFLEFLSRLEKTSDNRQSQRAQNSD